MSGTFDEVSDGFRQDSILARIVSYVDTARQEPVGERPRQAALRCVLDLLGAAASGINQPGVLAARKTALTTMAAGDVPIWFSGTTSSVVGAAWANSAAAAALDLDDGHRLARGHPGAAVIPAALAVAVETGASLDDIVHAIIIGYEVGVTVGAARTTYGNTGTWSSYAVVATAAVLRRTAPEILAHALAIAGESSPNQLFASAPAPRNPAPEGSDVKEGIAWSVVTGLVALSLAEAGHTGPRNILDSTRHYRFCQDLRMGVNPHVCNTYFKLYACCRHIHAPLDAMRQLLSRHPINPQAIDKIEVESTSGAMRISNRVNPTNLVDVQYSIPYCIALATLHGSQALLPPTPAVLGQSAVIDLARKVTLSVNTDFDARFPAETLARVTVTVNGRNFVSDVIAPKGEASDPLSSAELEAKFRIATRFSLTADHQDGILAAMNEADGGDMSYLMRSIR
ncbi:MmgE/PrpD family protein [Rhizobium sp. SSA_523]|uniref:MmgE/PrpD family protein n=1 Tax=Rhizobium sp. SSA_523 TaxID=2952477 RepID=UPI002090D037|nr:MmgE/PrpD family protein [Rhizobium sp. SSA_523]MCO5731626.1 MmgE/PrpD family protein [Rhizobium sp. SSA_523]WKC21864.1 MmgE/PrpD family protein [Rhizobium sp. SSA_523]